MNAWDRGFLAASLAAMHSDAKNPGRRMGAALFSGAKCLSVGFNKMRQSHPKYWNGEYHKGVHAELSAIIKRRHYDKTDNLTMYVFRLNGGCSKPCPDCMAAMIEAGVTRVRFIDENGFYSEIKL